MDKVIKDGALRLMITETTCDVILSCSDHRLMAHKLILSIASPILKELLRKTSADSSVLILPDIDSSTMTKVLDYVYTGNTTVQSHMLEEFLSVAKFLQIDIDEKNLKPKKIEDDIKHESKSCEKKVPDLLPITKKMFRKNERKMCKVVVPSPWCQRDEKSFMGDPRAVNLEEIESQKIHKPHYEDSNNNCQLTFNKESKSPKSLNTIIQHLYHKSEPKAELPKVDNFPFSQQLSNLLLQTTQSADRIENLTVAKTLQVDPNENSNSLDVECESQNSVSEDSDGKKEEEEVKKKPFKCEQCGKGFSQLRNYKYHRSVHEGTKEFSAKCPECGKTFNDRGYLSSHMKIHRDRKEYACPDCPKRFNQRVAYNMHLRIHTGVKPHECPTCGKSFSRKMLLKQHQRVHTGERPYSCPECGKTFADRSNMSLHARLHTGVKPYACTLCSKSFTKKHHLKTHMNFHTGLKPYSCEKCGLAFSQSSNMRTHFKKCILKEGSKSDKKLS